jgi:hypothetical protein
MSGEADCFSTPRMVSSSAWARSIIMPNSLARLTTDLPKSDSPVLSDAGTVFPPQPKEIEPTGFFE